MLAHTQWHSLHCRRLQRVARTEGRVALLPFCKHTHTHTQLLSCISVLVSMCVCTVKAQNLRSVFKFCGIKFLISFFQKDQEKVSQTLSVRKREKDGEGKNGERKGQWYEFKRSEYILYIVCIVPWTTDEWKHFSKVLISLIILSYHAIKCPLYICTCPALYAYAHATLLVRPSTRFSCVFALLACLAFS